MFTKTAPSAIMQACANGRNRTQQFFPGNGNPKDREESQISKGLGPNCYVNDQVTPGFEAVSNRL
jgi:hypothetical protein